MIKIESDTKVYNVYVYIYIYKETHTTIECLIGYITDTFGDDQQSLGNTPDRGTECTYTLKPQYVHGSVGRSV